MKWIAGKIRPRTRLMEKRTSAFVHFHDGVLADHQLTIESTLSALLCLINKSHESRISVNQIFICDVSLCLILYRMLPKVCCVVPPNCKPLILPISTRLLGQQHSNKIFPLQNEFQRFETNLNFNGHLQSRDCHP